MSNSPWSKQQKKTLFPTCIELEERCEVGASQISWPTGQLDNRKPLTPWRPVSKPIHYCAPIPTNSQ